MLGLSRYQWQELMNLGTQERSKLEVRGEPTIRCPLYASHWQTRQHHSDCFFKRKAFPFYKYIQTYSFLNKVNFCEKNLTYILKTHKHMQCELFFK